MGAVWRLHFSVIGSADGLLENRFLNLMAFSEGYHRAIRDHLPLTRNQASAARSAIKEALKAVDRESRDLFLTSLAYANSLSQRKRIVELATDTKLLLGKHWDFEPNDECRAMVDTRNWMTHWGGRTKYVRDDPESLVWFCRHLELIAYVAILRDLKLTEDEILDAVGNGWVLENLLS